MKYLILTLLTASLLISCKEKKEEQQVLPSENKTTQETAATGHECYLEVVGKDSLMLSFNREGEDITGEFNWKHFEKDNKKGTFRGKLNGMNAITIAEASAEGMTAKEDLQFTIEENIVKVKFGGMEEGADGVWHYMKGQPVSEQVLSKVDCP